MDFDNARKAKTKQKTMQKGTRKRGLPVSHLRMEVLDLLSCRRHCLGGSSHVLFHPCKAVPAEPRRRETGEMGQLKKLELKSS